MTPNELCEAWLEGVHPSWQGVLEPVRDSLTRAAEAVVAATAHGDQVAPANSHVLRALQTPLESVRVLIVGQDPYPSPGHAVGLSFSVDPAVRPLPASLRNIFRELTNDVGCALPVSGDLSAWADQGVMLLNRVLTVREGSAGSMRKCGWEEVTLAVVRALANRSEPPVAILWGADAAPLVDVFGAESSIVSVHPSPLSAHRGFFGSQPFSRANALLSKRGQSTINWALPA